MKRVLGLAGLLFATTAAAGIDFSDYHDPTQAAAALTALEAAHPTLAKVVTIGTTGGGRPIQALKISDDVAVDEPQEGEVVFIGAHHAREWLTVEMSLYLAEYLLDHYAIDPALKADMDSLQIWIVPISNPDGVAHTWDPAGYRYWRKNRRDNGDGTYGVDLNRNWGFGWGLDGGSSPYTSDDTYRGPTAFSELETSGLRDFLLGLHNLKAFLSYHTFSELFLRPWSYTAVDPPGEQTLHAVADREIALLATIHGHTYGESIWYTSSGETTDYLWGVLRTAAFTTEMRPTCCGLSGFSPPVTEIVPNAEENLPAALALIHDAGAREVWIRDYAGDTGAEPSAVWTATGWSQAFWLSPDIWTVPAELNQGATVNLHVRVHNDTAVTKNDVKIDVYYTDPRISLEFPSLNAILIGSRTVSVPPGDSTVVLPWTVPVGNNSWGERHWCVGAIVHHANDMPLTTQAQRSANVGIRNFQTTEVVEGGLLMYAATNFLRVPAELQVHVDRSSLPRTWQVVVPPRPTPPHVERTATQRKAALLGVEGIVLEPGETILLPVRVEVPRGARPGTTGDVTLHAALLPLVAGKREAVGNGFTYRVVAKGDHCRSR